MEYFNIETTVELKIPGDDETVEYRCWFDFDYLPGKPASIYGLPENCYPFEPDEYEISKIQLEISDGIWCNLNREHFHILEERLTDVAIDFINDRDVVGE